MLSEITFQVFHLVSRRRYLFGQRYGCKSHFDYGHAIRLIEPSTTFHFLPQPIIDPDLWGYPYNDATDPLLIHLSRVLSLSNPTYRVKTEAEQAESDSADEVEEDVFRPQNDGSEKRSTKQDNEEGKIRDPLDGIDVGPGMKPIVEDGAELGPPSLVVSVESDAIEFGWTNWREVGLSRADQIVQWTIMVSSEQQDS